MWQEPPGLSSWRQLVKMFNYGELIHWSAKSDVRSDTPEFLALWQQYQFLVAAALPNDEDYGAPIEADDQDLAALFAHLRGEPERQEDPDADGHG